MHRGSCAAAERVPVWGSAVCIPSAGASRIRFNGCFSAAVPRPVQLVIVADGGWRRNHSVHTAHSGWGAVLGRVFQTMGVGLRSVGAVRSQRFLILIGAVAAWLSGALVGSPAHFVVAGGDARHAPGAPQPVWVGIGESWLVASEQRERGGGDDGPDGAVWGPDGFERVSRCSGLVCGPSREVRSYRGRVIGARSPPV